MIHSNNQLQNDAVVDDGLQRELFNNSQLSIIIIRMRMIIFLEPILVLISYRNI